MPQLSISLSNSQGSTISGNGNVTDPAVIAAAQTVLDALNTAAANAAVAAKGA